MDETQLFGTNGEVLTNNKEKGKPLLFVASPTRLEIELVYL